MLNYCALVTLNFVLHATYRYTAELESYNFWRFIYEHLLFKKLVSHNLIEARTIQIPTLLEMGTQVLNKNMYLNVKENNSLILKNFVPQLFHSTMKCCFNIALESSAYLQVGIVKQIHNFNGERSHLHFCKHHILSAWSMKS